MLGLRLVFVLQNSPSGWRGFWYDWKVSALRLSGQTTMIGEEIPPIQAEYWLRQISQIPQTQTDPQIAMGAAWMLDSPQIYFYLNYLTTSEDPSGFELPLQFRRKLDEEAINTLNTEFESICHAACLAQSKTATELAPDNVELWRQRALLQFYIKNDYGLTPRHANWLSVLNEGATHDPDNALYDYLTAVHLYHQSVEHVWDDDFNHTLKITEPKKFELAEQRLQGGLKKPFLRFGTTTFSSTLAFVSDTSLPLEEQLRAAGSRNYLYRGQYNITRLIRWLSNASESELRQKNYSAAIEKARQELLIADQSTSAGNPFDLKYFRQFLFTSGYGNLIKIQHLHPPSFTPAETERINENLDSVWLEEKIYQESIEQYNQQHIASFSVKSPVTVYFTFVCQNFILLLFPLSLLLGLIVRLTGRKVASPLPRLGWWRTGIAWLTGCGLSLFLWCLFPINLFPEVVKTVTLLGLAWIVFTLLLLVFLRAIHKRGNIVWRQQLSLLLLFSVTIFVIWQFPSLFESIYLAWIQLSLGILTLLSLLLFFILGLATFITIRFLRSEMSPVRHKLKLCGMTLLLALAIVPLGTFLIKASLNPEQTNAWFSSTVQSEYSNLFGSPEELRQKLKLNHSPYQWAYLQWTWHKGEIFAVLLSLLFLFGWSLKRVSVKKEKECNSDSVTGHYRRAAQMTARSCLATLLILTTVYFAVAPAVIVAQDLKLENEYQTLLKPKLLKADFDQIKSEIQADQSLMQQYREEIISIRERLIEDAESMSPSHNNIPR
ncbi:hypothetical protein [Gimesia algae]|nr:hypothetical protein [Gimesia algae]